MASGLSHESLQRMDLGGFNADVLDADAYVKKLTGIDWDLDYKAMVNDAENEPLEWLYEGRGGLRSWKWLNYIPYLDFDYLEFGTNSRSISRSVEYAYNDHCVAVVGKYIGKDYTTYLSFANKSTFLCSRLKARWIFHGSFVQSSSDRDDEVGISNGIVG